MNLVRRVIDGAGPGDSVIKVSLRDLGPFVISSRSMPGRRAHLPAQAVAVSRRFGRTRLMADTKCGSDLLTASFHGYVPDGIELCDLCALVDFIPAVVYRLFDRDGALLYVGCTKDLAVRLRGHLFGDDPKPWRERIDRWTYEPYASYEEALAAEARAILTEEPPFNVDLTERAKHPRRRRSANLHLVGAA